MQGNTPSKNQQVLQYLKTGIPLTSVGAFTKFNVTRLAAVVGQLKKQGHDIRTTLYTNHQSKNKTRFAAYHLVPDSSEKNR